MTRYFRPSLSTWGRSFEKENKGVEGFYFRKGQTENIILKLSLYPVMSTGGFWLYLHLKIYIQMHKISANYQKVSNLTFPNINSWRVTNGFVWVE